MSSELSVILYQWSVVSLDRCETSIFFLSFFLPSPFFFGVRKSLKQISFLIDYYLRRSGKLDRLVTDLNRSSEFEYLGFNDAVSKIID